MYLHRCQTQKVTTGTNWAAGDKKIYGITLVALATVDASCIVYKNGTADAANIIAEVRLEAHASLQTERHQRYTVPKGADDVLVVVSGAANYALVDFD